jgi:RHS repeat-associated protein
VCYYSPISVGFKIIETRFSVRSIESETQITIFKVRISYYPYGGCLESQGNLGTDNLFTGQRLDSSGLYYYGARYYDPIVGRFISADNIVPNAMNPQALNRYSYVVNNPLKYVDPTGMVFEVNYNWTEQDYMYYMSYGATAMPVEATYQNMMNDSELPLEYKTDLQLAHDADNIVISFGEFTDNSIYELQSVPSVTEHLGFYYDGKSSERYFDYGENRIWTFGDGWDGEWMRTSRPRSNDISFDWGGLGRAAGGTALIVGGAGCMSSGIATLAFSASGLNVPGVWASSYFINWGWSRCSNGVKLVSSGQYSLPGLDPITSQNTFNGTGISSWINLFKIMMNR